MDDDTIANVKAHKTFTKFGKITKGEDPEAGERRQKAIIDAFGDSTWASTVRQLRRHLESLPVQPRTARRRTHHPDTQDARRRRHPPQPRPRTPKTTGPRRVIADTDLRDTETVPLPDCNDPWDADPADRLASPDYRREVDRYMDAEVLPWVPDAWVDSRADEGGVRDPIHPRVLRLQTPPRPLPRSTPTSKHSKPKYSGYSTR